MATYLELHGLQSHSDLQDRVGVAATKKAHDLLNLATPSSQQVQWAREAIENPRSKALSLLNYVLAKHSDATVSTIESASDSQIQTAVDEAADALISGLA